MYLLNDDKLISSNNLQFSNIDDILVTLFVFTLKVMRFPLLSLFILKFYFALYLKFVIYILLYNDEKFFMNDDFLNQIML